MVGVKRKLETEENAENLAASTNESADNGSSQIQEQHSQSANNASPPPTSHTSRGSSNRSRGRGNTRGRRGRGGKSGSNSSGTANKQAPTNQTSEPERKRSKRETSAASSTGPTRQSARIQKRRLSASSPPASNGQPTDTDPVLTVTSENGITEQARLSENKEADASPSPLIPTIEENDADSFKRQRTEEEDDDSNSQTKRQKSNDSPDPNLLLQPGTGRVASSATPTPTGALSAVEEQDESSAGNNTTALQSEEPADPLPAPKLTFSATRGKGGAGRGRGRGRGSGGRSRGRGRGRGGGSSNLRSGASGGSADSEPQEHMRGRQGNLRTGYKKVASIQKTVLAKIGERTESTLVSSKTAHQKVLEYEAIINELKGFRSERQLKIMLEYNYEVRSQEEKLRQEKDRLEKAHRAHVEHTRDEHLVAAAGSYMAAALNGGQVADEDQTEDENEAEGETRTLRGVNSSFVRAPEGSAQYMKAGHGWESFKEWAQTGGRGAPPKIVTTQPLDFGPRETSEKMASFIGTSIGDPLPDEDIEPNPGWKEDVLEDRAKVTNLRLPHDVVMLISLVEDVDPSGREAYLRKAYGRILRDMYPSRKITDEEWREGLVSNPTNSQLLDRTGFLCQLLEMQQTGGHFADDVAAAWKNARSRIEKREGAVAVAAKTATEPTAPTQTEVDRQDSEHLAAAHGLYQAHVQEQDEARKRSEAAHTLTEVGTRVRSEAAQTQAAAEVRARAQADEAARQPRAKDGAHRPLLPAGRGAQTHPHTPSLPPPPPQSQQPIIPAARAAPLPLSRPILPSGFREPAPPAVPQRPGEQGEGRRHPFFEHLRLPNPDPQAERLPPLLPDQMPHRNFGTPHYTAREVAPMAPLYDRGFFGPPGPPTSGAPPQPYYVRQYAHSGQVPPPPPPQPTHPHHAVAYGPHGSHTHHPPPRPPPPGPGRY